MTGHSYIVYGPLCNGATSIMFEGVPTFPDAGRFWQIIEKFKVDRRSTPRPPRSARSSGWARNGRTNTTSASLRVLGSVGEPINPEAWMWYYRVIGKETLPDRGHLVADRNRRRS